MEHWGSDHHQHNQIHLQQVILPKRIHLVQTVRINRHLAPRGLGLLDLAKLMLIRRTQALAVQALETQPLAIQLLAVQLLAVQVSATVVEQLLQQRLIIRLQAAQVLAAPDLEALGSGNHLLVQEAQRQVATSVHLVELHLVNL